MKIRFLIKDSSIFQKIMAAFLAALFPLMAITWLINEKGSDNIRSEISESILNTTRFYLDSLDKEADRISRYLPNYVMDKDLMEIATTGNYMSYYDRAQKILDIQRRLELMKNSSPFIQEARAYIPLIDRTILSNKFETSMNKQEYASMQQNKRLYEEPFIYWNDRLFISMQYPINTVKNPIYIVAVELSTIKIRETLSQIGSSRGGQSVLLNLERGWEIESDMDPELLEQMKSFAADKRELQKDEGYETIMYNGKRFLTVYKYSSLWNSYSIMCIPEETILGSLEIYRTLFWWACALAVGIVVFFSYFLLRFIYRPLMKLVHSFRRVQQNRLEPIVIDRGADEFGYLYQAFNNTIRSLKTLIEENYEQQIRNQRSELKRLQSQINPHFLYNCFFVLCRLIKSENQKEKAYQFCLYIGQYFQFITRDDEDDIPLGLEVNHSRTYVDMQTICYGDRIQVKFEGDVPDLFVPRLILQPIIENAYKHALGNMIQQGELWVHCERVGDVFSIYVEDNGRSISDAEIEQLQKRLRQSTTRMEETTGIINVHRRIQLRYGEEYGITVSRSALGGLQVRINLSAN
ncbi:MULTISPECIES: sensor histidine kinase [Paenibacillus]|uniref:Sensor histidine kinase n=1 Tax=Paenibacillus odorifer TaxID=189426 RepID=A0A1R0ZBR7_9BACL|nr:histidine kinase [Paenibacillus odorifer]OMD47927.1 sensor histidine kinase [Paenibacillus odorifer]OME66361.1 sensor histidine kinase [Paenibacillus odorifer]